MPRCVAYSTELEPLARAPHTIYVKALYQVAGQTYCRHHIIRAAGPPASSPRSGPVVALSRE